MSVREKDDPALYTKIQEQNLFRQYDLLTNCIEIGLKKGIESFDKYTLWALNYAADSPENAGQGIAISRVLLKHD